MNRSIQEKRKIAKIVLVVSIISLLILAYPLLISDRDRLPKNSDASTLEDAKQNIDTNGQKQNGKFTDMSDKKETIQENIKEISNLLTRVRSQQIVGGILSTIVGLMLSTLVLYKIEKKDMFYK